jgi:DNA-binding transcriptional LysR family regulator
MQWLDRVGRRLKLRDLHILLVVAELGSMGKAAAQLGMTQPSVSKAISEMEHAVGLRLLDRSSQGVEPTIYGRALLRCGVAVFDELRHGVEELAFLTDPTAGDLRVGCTESIAAGFVAAVVERLAQQYPRAVFHVVPADRATLLTRELRQRIVELVVIGTPGLAPEADTEMDAVFDDPFAVMAGPQSKWARRKKVALAELVGEPWILPPLDSVPGHHIASVFRAMGLEPPAAQVLSLSIPMHQHLLATGRFLTMLPTTMLRLGRGFQLKRVPVKLLESHYRTGVVTLKGRTLSPLARLFVECCRDVSRNLGYGNASG